MAYSGSSPSPSRESKKYKAFFASSRIPPGHLGFGLCPLEPAGGLERVLLSTSLQGREALDLLLLLLLQWSLPGTRRGQGKGRTFVWALLRARNVTWYLKVHLGSDWRPE